MAIESTSCLTRITPFVAKSGLRALNPTGRSISQQSEVLALCSEAGMKRLSARTKLLISIGMTPVGFGIDLDLLCTGLAGVEEASLPPTSNLSLNCSEVHRWRN